MRCPFKIKEIKPSEKTLSRAAESPPILQMFISLLIHGVDALRARVFTYFSFCAAAAVCAPTGSYVATFLSQTTFYRVTNRKQLFAPPPPTLPLMRVFEMNQPPR